MMDPAEALLGLGCNFLGQDCYVQAAQCLLAVCKSKALPTTLAKGRLLLAQLLLDHTYNIQDAKQHLTAAELNLRSLPGHYTLKCETFDTLAKCHQQLGALSHQREAFLCGLRICQEGTRSKERAALLRWTAYFHFKLADQSFSSTSAHEAMNSIQQLGQVGSFTGDEQVLYLLARAFLNLHVSRYQAADTDLRHCRQLIDELSDQESVKTLQLRVHMLVLGVSVSLAKGTLMDLSTDGTSCGVLHSLQQLMNKLGGQEWSYNWLPVKQVETILALIHATFYRCTGKISAVKGYLDKAEELVNDALQNCQFSLERSEGSLHPHTVWKSKGFVLLKLLVLEQHALLSLMTTSYIEAARYIAALIGIMQRFPVLLRDFKPSVSMLQGFYAQSMADYPAAIGHFKSVLACESSSHLHPMAAGTAALCELQNDESMAGSSKALEHLQCETLQDGSKSDRALEEILTPSDKAVHQLVSALVALRQGDAMAAKVQLARTLKMSHKSLGICQFVGSVLVALAPVQMNVNDSTGAAGLLDSAFTILKGIRDVPSMLASLSEMTRLLERQRETEKLKRNYEYIDRKTQELHDIMSAARASKEHHLVLQWSLMEM